MKIDNYKSPYEQYKKYSSWKVVERVIKKLEENNDIQLTTHKDLVIGSLVKAIEKSP